MPRVYYSTVIDAPVDAVWELTRDFDGLPKWHPGIVDSELEQGTGVGCVRHFTLKGGAKMREKLLALSDADRAVAYSILETGMSPFFTSHRSSPRIRRLRSGRPSST